MNDLDKLENYKTELTKQIGENKQRIENIKVTISNLQSEYDRTVMKQLRAMGDDKRLQTSSWRYNRSIADPSKAIWWRAVKADDTKFYKIYHAVSW